MSRRIAITAPDVTASGYSGMGLRALGIAGALSRHYDVRVLAAGRPEYLPWDDVDLEIGAEAHRRALDGAEVVITSNALRVRQLLRSRAAVISDLYDPSYFEWLVLPQTEHEARRSWARRQLIAMRRALRISDAILCANDRQRDLYLGALLAGAPLGGLLAHDELNVRNRVLTVPNGVTRTEHLPSSPQAREQLGLGPDDVLFLWGGGVWDWLDTETVLRAALNAHDRDSRIRLLFLGVRRGDELDPHASRAERLLGSYLQGTRSPTPIIVNDRWVGPEERLAYLAAADAGILGQEAHLETRFSFRTRFIDCLQAGLPILSMPGDELSERAHREGWGLVSGVGQVSEMADNMVLFANDGDLRRRLGLQAGRVAAELVWENTCRPLVEALPQISPPDHRQRVNRQMTLLPAAARSIAARPLRLVRRRR